MLPTRRLAFVALLGMICACGAARADTLEFPIFNVRVVVPDSGWMREPSRTEADMQVVFLLVDSATRARSVGFVTGDATGVQSIEDEGAAGEFEKGFMRRADTLLYRGRTTLGGIPAREFVIAK